MLAGNPYFSHEVAKIVLNDVHEQGGGHPNFTAREIQTLKLLSIGLSTKAIAEALGVSGKTIETYRFQIMKKVGVKSIAELTKFAIKEGFTSL